MRISNKWILIALISLAQSQDLQYTVTMKKTLPIPTKSQDELEVKLEEYFKIENGGLSLVDPSSSSNIITEEVSFPYSKRSESLVLFSSGKTAIASQQQDLRFSWTIHRNTGNGYILEVYLNFELNTPFKTFQLDEARGNLKKLTLRAFDKDSIFMVGLQTDGKAWFSYGDWEFSKPSETSGIADFGTAETTYYDITAVSFTKNKEKNEDELLVVATTLQKEIWVYKLGHFNRKYTEVRMDSNARNLSAFSSVDKAGDGFTIFTWNTSPGNLRIHGDWNSDLSKVTMTLWNFGSQSITPFLFADYVSSELIQKNDGSGDLIHEYVFYNPLQRMLYNIQSGFQEIKPKNFFFSDLQFTLFYPPIGSVPKRCVISLDFFACICSGDQTLILVIWARQQGKYLGDPSPLRIQKLDIDQATFGIGSLLNVEDYHMNKFNYVEKGNDGKAVIKRIELKNEIILKIDLKQGVQKVKLTFYDNYWNKESRVQPVVLTAVDIFGSNIIINMQLYIISISFAIVGFLFFIYGVRTKRNNKNISDDNNAGKLMDMIN